MEEKRYPTVEEESFGGMVSEPVAAPVPDTMSADGMTEVHDRIDDLDWDKFPSFGPFSDEEAIARIEKAQAEINDPSKWIRIDDLHAELKKLHPWL